MSSAQQRYAGAPSSSTSAGAAPTTTYAISYSSLLTPLFFLMWMGPSSSAVELSPSTLRVRFGYGGWGFCGDIPRATIRSARPDTDLVLGWGVHTDLAGTFLVNGSSAGLVSLQVEPPASARVCGITVSVSRLRLSLERPEAFLRELIE